MTGDDLLPNGMRLGQRVRVFSAAGRKYGVLAEGKVVGWQDSPTVVLRDGDRPAQHVIARAEWEPLEDDEEDAVATIESDGQIAIRSGNTTWTMTPGEWFALAQEPPG